MDEEVFQKDTIGSEGIVEVVQKDVYMIIIDQ